MSDFWGAFGPTNPNAGYSTNTDAAWERRMEELREEEYNRNFFERLFAPFEAPQQTLFKFTTEVADDGLQARDVLDAFAHGARYFNPFGNTKPISPDEIRTLFFDEDQGKTSKFLSNTAISLLYDPLLFVGALKGAKLLSSGTTAEAVLKGITNPAEVILSTAARTAKRTIGPVVRRIGVAATGGEAQYSKLATNVVQAVVSKYAGVPEEVVQAAERLDQGIHRWRERAYTLLRSADNIRGRQGQELLAEGLQLDAVYLRRSGKALNARQQKALDNFDERLLRSGIDEDRFYQILDEYRHLDDEIGENLLRAGIIEDAEFEAMRGTHLRRMYAAFERPAEYIDRIEALMETVDPQFLNDTQRFSRAKLLKGLTEFRKSIDELMAGRSELLRDINVADDARVNFAASAWHNQYFSEGRFNPKKFTDDLMGWLDSSDAAAKSPSEVFDYVADVMLEGVDMPPEFWERIGNHIADSGYTQLGLTSYRDKLNQVLYGSQMSFRTIKERLEVVSARENLPQEIREALGEVLTAAPRIATEASDAGKLLEFRHFTDTLSGTVRMTDEAVDLAEAANSAILRNDVNGASAILEDIKDVLAESSGFAREKLDDLTLDDLLTKGIGDEVAVLGTDVARKERWGNAIPLPDDASYGNMAGMFVDPGTYTFVSRMEGIGNIGNVNKKWWMAVGDAIANGTSHYKIFKAVLDPVAQVRNFLGNMVLMDLAGVSPLRVDNMRLATQELIKYGKTGELGEYMTWAQRSGTAMFQNTWSRQELQNVANMVAEDRVTRGNVFDVMGSIYDGLSRLYKGVSDKGIALFSFNERMFKMTTFIDRFNNLRSSHLRRTGQVASDELLMDFAKQSAALADQALFNYADVPYIVDFARKYGVVPFVTFPFKAAPFVLDRLHKSPWRVLKYERLAGEINNVQTGGPEETAKEVNALPEHIRDGMVIKLPWNDDAGRPLYVDTSYFMPWYVLQDLIGSGGGDLNMGSTGGFREGLVGQITGGPWMEALNALTRNEDGLGKPIVTPDMSTIQKFEAAAGALTEFWAPPSTPFYGSRAQSIGRALQAVARNQPETIDWLNRAGAVLAGDRLDVSDNVFPRPGFLPQSQAQVGINPENFAATAAGTLGGFLLGGAQASDTPQQTLQAMSQADANLTEIAREMARIRSSSLPTQERIERMRRLQQLRLQALRDRGQRLGELY